MSLIGRKSLNHPQQVVARGPVDEVDDRRTTDETFEECCRLAGVDSFDLDPAATRDSSRGVRFYDIEMDGLAQPWLGCVWVNPPYSDIRPWVEKAAASAWKCETIAMLLPANRTEQAWWQDLIEPGRLDGTIKVFFLRGRRRFNRRPGWTPPKGGDRPPFGLCLVVFQ